MKVVHVNTADDWRGGEQQVLWLLQGLFDVASEAGEPLELVLIAQRGGVLAERARAAGVEVTEMRMGASGDFLASWRLSRWLRRETPDVIHLHTGHAHSIGSRAARWSGRARPKVILHRHVGYSPNRRRWPFDLHHLKFTWGVDRIVCVADAVRARMEQGGLPGELLTVVPNGIDPAPSPPDAAAIRAMRDRAGADDGLLVGSMGALTREKGHDDLVDAFALLDPERTGARLAVAGDGPLRGDLEARARRLGVGDRVTWLGFVDDAPSFLRAVDVFAFPSREEGAPLTILEAMLAGAPILSTTAGGIPELVRDGIDGVLVAPGDTAALAAALADLLEASAARKARVESAASRVRETFDYHATARRMLAVYRDVLGA